MSNAKNKYSQTTIDSVDVSSSAPMFKVKEDTTFRIGFPLLNDNGTVAIIPLTHFANKDKSGQFWSVRLTDEVRNNREVLDLLYKELGEPKNRWVTIVMQYETNSEGKISKPVTGSLKGIKLSKKDVQALKAINTSNKLSLTDFLVSTDNEQMQAKAFVAITKDGKPNALWKNNKVSEIDKEADSDEIEIKGVWEADSIINESWDMIESVLDSIAKEYEPKSIISLLKGEDDDENIDEDDDEGDEEWQEAKPKTKPSKKHSADDDLEEID